MSLEQAILDRLETRNAQISQLQSTIQALERAADAEREHARQQLTPLIEENKKLAAQIDEVTNERDKAQRQVMTDRAFIGGCYECAKKHGIKDGEYLDQFIMRIASTLQEVTTERDQAEADAKTAQADAQRLGDECARLAGKVAELEAQAKCERDKLKARLEPLENMYETVKGIRLEMQIIGKYKQVQAAIDEAMKALSQLTA